jgi:hypothetical protein
VSAFCIVAKCCARLHCMRRAHPRRQGACDGPGYEILRTTLSSRIDLLFYAHALTILSPAKDKRPPGRAWTPALNGNTKVNAETLLSLLLCVFSATSPLIRASSPPRLALESHPCPINTGTETHPKTTFHPPAPIIICMLITNQLRLTASLVKSWIGFCKCDNAIGDKKIRGQKSCLESLRVPVRYLLPAAEIRARSYWLQPNSEFGSIDSYSPKPPMIRNRTLNLSVLGHYYFAAAAPASPKSCAFIESTFRTHESNLPNTSEELSPIGMRAPRSIFPFPALSDRCNSIRPVLALCAARQLHPGFPI